MSDPLGVRIGTDDCMPVNSSDITSHSNKTTEFSVYEQAFAVPHGVTAITTTTTKFGVSTKDIISGSQ
jgi:antitoxin component HigA of HigAB toxin-antitoxin module